MRARAVLTVLSLVPVLLGAQQRGQDTRPGIAVLPFTNGGSYGQAKEDFDALERGIAGMMISELQRNPAARVVERDQITQLLSEQNLGAQGRVDSATIARVGKVTGRGTWSWARSSISTVISGSMSAWSTRRRRKS